jgi:hypothetical protein
MGLFLSKQYIERTTQKLASSESKVEQDIQKQKVPVELKSIDNTKLKTIDTKYLR